MTDLQRTRALDSVLDVASKICQNKNKVPADEDGDTDISHSVLLPKVINLT